MRHILLRLYLFSVGEDEVFFIKIWLKKQQHFWSNLQAF